MLEIYNETIRDLLSTTNKSASDATRVENGTPGKQYTIKHDASGNTHVTDLTVVDVQSVKEVAYLLNQAANSRLLHHIRFLHNLYIVFLNPFVLLLYEIKVNKLTHFGFGWKI